MPYHIHLIGHIVNPDYLFFIITILLFALCIVLFDAYISPEKTSKSPANREDYSIAVLPLNNMSSHTDNTFFAGGIHEEILNSLSKINGFKVISRTTVLSYQKSGKSLPQIDE